MITKCIITKNPVCLEWFRDKVDELCLTFGGYSLELCYIEEHLDGLWYINAVHEEMDSEDGSVFPSAELAMHQAEAYALQAFGLEKDCEGKDALAAYLSKERKDATH